MSRIMPVSMALLMLLGGAGIRAQQSSLADRIVPPRDPQQPVVMQLPTDSSSVMITVAQLASSARTPMGLELQPREVLPEGIERRRQNRPVVYEGHSLRESLNAIAGAVPGYQWRERDGLLEMQPAGAKSFLDTPVTSFQVKDVNVSTALSAVHQLFDPAFKTVPRVNTGRGFGPQPGTGAARERAAADEEAFTRTLSVDLKNTSVRNILDAIVRAHGGGLWIVAYVRAPASYATSQIGFQAFSGSRIMLGATAVKSE